MLHGFFIHSLIFIVHSHIVNDHLLLFVRNPNQRNIVAAVCGPVVLRWHKDMILVDFQLDDQAPIVGRIRALLLVQKEIQLFVKLIPGYGLRHGRELIIFLKYAVRRRIQQNLIFEQIFFLWRQCVDRLIAPYGSYSSERALHLTAITGYFDEELSYATVRDHVDPPINESFLDFKSRLVPRILL